GRLVVARRDAPRGPEVQDDDPAPERGEVERPAVEGRQGERRGRATHERGGDGARIRAEGVAEEGEHRQRGEGDEPAPARRHGRAALPRASGWAPSGAARVLRRSRALAAPSWGGRYSSECLARIVLAWKAPSAPTVPSTTAPRPSPNRSGGRPRKRT